MQRTTSVLAITLGAIAILGLLGVIHGLPAYATFFVSALAIILFPGVVLSVVAPSRTDFLSLPELLALWFVLGTGLLAMCGFVGLALHARLNHLTLALSSVYAAFIILLVVRMLVKRTGSPDSDELQAQRVDETSQQPTQAHPRPSVQRSTRRLTCIILLAVAIGSALITLATPRDVDDWYYLAYVRDFVAGHALRSEDAILDMGHPASPRIWYASWWVVEAMLSKATGVDPVACHQIFLPLLLVPFTVLAFFMLSRQVFRSERRALLGCLFQVLFYLSSAYPYNSTGWLVFCRISQDKALACFGVVPVVIALALRFMRVRGGISPGTGAPGAPRAVTSGTATSGVSTSSPSTSSPSTSSPFTPWSFVSGTFTSSASVGSGSTFGLYVFALVSSALIHPLALVWSGLAVMPFALVETLRERSRTAAVTLILLVLPIMSSGAFLARGMNEVSAELERKALKQTEAAKQMEAEREAEDLSPVEAQLQTGRVRQVRGEAGTFSFHLPGDGFSWSSSEADYSTTLRHKGKPVAANPLYITRYPLAGVGLILTFFLFFYVRRHRSARFLISTTLAILVLAFVPMAATLSARVLTWKLVYRLAWIFPWGLTIGFFVSRIKLRFLPTWVPPWAILVLVALALARGNPDNYVKALGDWRHMARPQPQAVDALRFLGTEPSPQGVVLASPGVSRFIPAFLADAYPATYRGSGTLPRKRLEALLNSSILTPDAVEEIKQAQCKYVLVETSSPLARALSQSSLDLGRSDFRLMHENEQYAVWKLTPSRYQ